MATIDPLDGTEPSSNADGRPPALKPEHIAVLHDIVTARAQASLQEIADELHHRCGLRMCAATIRRALRAEGIVRLKPVHRAHAGRAEGAKRYGYTVAHRREDIAPYSTNLTDAEWELVADLFERVPGQRETPVHYSRRDLVSACSYVLRTGCAWRLLPDTFPPWQAVYKAFSRWVRAGVFEQMQDRLREQWRARIGREHAKRASDRCTVHPCLAARWRKRIRRSQEGQGTKAQSCRRYDGAAHRRLGKRRERAGQRRCRSRGCASVRQEPPA
jgi:transposase